MKCECLNKVFRWQQFRGEKCTCCCASGSDVCVNDWLEAKKNKKEDIRGGEGELVWEKCSKKREETVNDHIRIKTSILLKR